jgi:hypothetical protein
MISLGLWNELMKGMLTTTNASSKKLHFSGEVSPNQSMKPTAPITRLRSPAPQGSSRRRDHTAG